MIIEPKMRGFLCTTAHPVGCAAGVQEQIAYVQGQEPIDGAKRVLVLGCSTGYGLASRITAAFGCGAATLGVSFERPSNERRTASAGWYNNRAFEQQAAQAGLIAETINGDAFTKDIKDETIAAIRRCMPEGKVDLVIYSLAAPKRTDPETGEVYHSVIKPIGAPFAGKTVDFHTGRVSELSIEPASEAEAASTVKVMGGEDWLLWVQALLEADVLAQGAATLSYSYIGPEMTHPIYRDGTIGRAKLDMEEKAEQIKALLAPIGGAAFVSVNKALVTQASAAIPVVPLYMSLLFKRMKEDGTHEDCIRQIYRLFHARLYQGADWSSVPVDEGGRIRIDDWEMRPALQAELAALWEQVDSENIDSLSDLAGYRDDFYRLFGFRYEGVDYAADISEF